MARGGSIKHLLAKPAVAALVTDLALKVGAFAIRRGADRVLGPAAVTKPRKRRKALLMIAPVAVAAGAGALATLLYRRSEARRKRIGRR